MSNNSTNNWKKLIYKYSPYLSAHIDSCINSSFNVVLRETKASIIKDLSRQEVMSILRQAKKKLSTIAAIHDLKGEWDDLTVMNKLSGFADLCVQEALKKLLEIAYEEGKIKSPDLKNCGVSIIALGKLGGYELNYSSDIDIMAVFDYSKSPLVKTEDTQKFFIRLIRELAEFLEKFTADGYVFRTDLRLRPDPGAMPLAISLTTAETYYTSLGQNWERAAMIKARPIAGDASVGEDFLKIINSWIWRKNLDFATIQDIHSIKRQINAKQKKSNEPFNVKLGHGGIREIEFFAQTQQLIYGGREPSLRVSDTLSALKELEKTGHISGKTRKALTESYLFLRRTEHRLQMQEDKQIHTLPATAQELEDFAHFMEFTSGAAFTKTLEKHTHAVKKSYAELFTESQSLSESGNLVFTGIEDDPETLNTIKNMGFNDPEKITAAIRGWHHGRYRASRSEKARQILTEIIPTLLKTFSKTSNPDSALIHFDTFLSRLPSGIPIFSMFMHNPRQMELVAEILGTSPAMAEHLGKHPEVLDGVLSKNYFGQLPNLEHLMTELNAILKTARDYEDILDLTRRFARDKRFHAGIHLLKALTPIDRISLYLSDIAEASINCIMPYITKEFQKNYGRFKSGKFSLVVMGSLAGKKLSIDSDLDLVAVYHVDKKEALSSGKKPISPSLYYTRLMQRIVSALSAPTAEGILYKVDTRLRPAGNAGALAISDEGFKDYYKKSAWTWEYMSLIRSRVISSDTALKNKMEKEISNILAKPREANKLREDIIEMREKVEKEFSSKNKWDMKYCRGGMMDIIFITHYLTLLHAGKTQPHANIGKCLQNLIAHKIISTADGTLLIEAYNLFHDVQNFLRLSAKLPFDEKKAPQTLKAAMAQSILQGDKNCYFKNLKSKINEYMAKSFTIYNDIFSLKN